MDCCYAGVKFLKDVVKGGCLVDPFCGHGTTIAMANALDMNAIGVEISFKRCGKARRNNMCGKLHLVSKSIRQISIEPHSKNKNKSMSTEAEASDRPDATASSTGYVSSCIVNNSVQYMDDNPSGGRSDRSTSRISVHSESILAIHASNQDIDILKEGET